MIACLLHRKLWDTCIFLFHIFYWIIYFQLLLNFPVTEIIAFKTRAKLGRNMTSCNQLKANFFILLFHLIIVYFVRERFHLYIGIYIFMKITFSFLIKKLRKLAKTPKFVLKKQNKTKKLRSNNKNNKKRI